MNAAIHPQAGDGAVRRRDRATARTPARSKPAGIAMAFSRAAFAALLLYAMLVLLYPPALSGVISVPTAPGSIVDVFDLTMAALMPRWLLFPVHTRIGDGAARAAAALVLCASTVALRGR